MTGLAAAAPGQRNRNIEAPLEVRGSLLGPRDADRVDELAPKLPESRTLDRFLRKAQDLLGHGDEVGAIGVLQRVIEGEVTESGGDPDGAAELPADPDPAHAVYSGDGRLFRPVERLCREFLVSMPESARTRYRDQFEVVAERAYQAALADFDARELQAVYDRWVVTLAAGRALAAAGDLLLHRGRYRASIQAYRALLEAYPADLRAAVAEADPVYLAVKIALCYARAGERARADDWLRRLEAEHGGVIIQIQGEPTPVASLRDGPFFGAAQRPARGDLIDGGGAMPAEASGLVALWQHRFAEPDPYRAASVTSAARRGMRGTATVAPRHRQFVPGGSVQFLREGRFAFLDHYRARVAEIGTGKLRRQSSGALKPPQARRGTARSRVPVYDWSTQRVVTDDQHHYAVIGARGSLASTAGLTANQLVAYRRSDLEPIWSSRSWQVRPTMLAAPVVAGPRLLVPTLHDGVYALQAVDKTTGEPRFRVPLHTGGTELTRAVTVPVVLQQGTAFVLTNAGVIAAVDSYSGELRWARRYERRHPLHRSKPSLVRKPRVRSTATFREMTLTGFAPSDLLVVEGRVIAAPADGDALLCLDGATGEPVWIIERTLEQDTYLLGHDARHVWLCATDALVCIDHRSGVRRWREHLPTAAWSGRGTLLPGGTVLIPGDRTIHALTTRGERRWTRFDLPTLLLGTEPLDGPCNLFAQGPYWLACYESGIEAYAPLAALQAAAAASEDPVSRSALLVQAGDLGGAIDALSAGLEGAGDVRRQALAARALRLAGDQATQLARDGRREAALGLLERARAWTATRSLRLRRQLLEVDVFRELGDGDRLYQAQQELYAMMEGRK
ncbi:MAG: PQQ-binding-like beta-propeller repeat protein [Planctomycetota bacterium]